MAVNLSFIGGAGWQFLDNNGDPLSGGKIFTYVAGTTTPQATFTSRTGLIANTNPIILDSAGRTPEQIWSTEGLLYKYVVTNANDVLIRNWDNIGGSVVASDLAQDLAAPSGSSLVGYLPAGTAVTVAAVDLVAGVQYIVLTSGAPSLGAVGSIFTATGSETGTGTAKVYLTVQAKLRETASVKDFGAVGDGVTDDTDAIQAAIDSLTGANNHRVVYFPNGTYNISRPLRLFTDQSLIGESITATTIVKTTTTPDTYGTVPARGGAVNDDYNVDSVISIIAAANNFSRFNRIENLTLSRTTLGLTSYGIYAPRFAYADFKNLNIIRATNGIFSYVLFLASIEDVMAQFCVNGFIIANDGTGLGGSTSLTLKRFYVNANNTVADPVYGFFIYGLNYSNLISCAVDGLRPVSATGVATAYFMSNCRGLVLDGCGTEGTQGTVIRAGGTFATVNGLRAGPIYGAAFVGSVAVRNIESSSFVTFNSAYFDAVTSPGTVFNNIIQTGAQLLDVNCVLPSGGSAFVSYSGGASWAKLQNGILSTQNTSTQRNAIYSELTPTQTVLAAGTTSVAGGGFISTGVTNTDSKYCFAQVKKDDDVVPTVAAHVVETFAGSDQIKIKFTKLSDGTVDTGTYDVTWCVMGNV
jgi:hypothetical protein